MTTFFGADVGNATLAAEILEKGVNLVTGQGGENLLKFEDSSALVVFKVPKDKFLVGFAVQTALAGVRAFFAREVVEALGKDVASSSAAAQEKSYR